MKKLMLLISVSILLLLFFTACPYDSKIALIKPNQGEIDTSLLGNWIGYSIKEGGDTLDLKVFNFNDSEYYIEIHVLSDDEIVRWRAFGKTILEVRVLNIQEVMNKEDGYCFYRYKIKGDTLSVSYASDDYVSGNFESSEALYSYFKDNMNKKSFFEQEMIFTKIK